MEKMGKSFVECLLLVNLLCLISEPGKKMMCLEVKTPLVASMCVCLDAKCLVYSFK